MDIRPKLIDSPLTYYEHSQVCQAMENASGQYSDLQGEIFDVKCLEFRPGLFSDKGWTWFFDNEWNDQDPSKPKRGAITSEKVQFFNLVYDYAESLQCDLTPYEYELECHFQGVHHKKINEYYHRYLGNAPVA